MLNFEDVIEIPFGSIDSLTFRRRCNLQKQIVLKTLEGHVLILEFFGDGIDIFWNNYHSSFKRSTSEKICAGIDICCALCFCCLH